MNLELAGIGIVGGTSGAAATTRRSALALVVEHVSVSSRRSGKFGAAVGASGLGCLARLFALVAEEVAKGGKLSTVASVLPASRLGPARGHPSGGAIRGGGGRAGRHLVHHRAVLAAGKRSRWRGLSHATTRSVRTYASVSRRGSGRAYLNSLLWT